METEKKQMKAAEKEKTPEPMPVVNQPEPEKELYRWQAPARLYKKRSREFYSTVAILVLLLSLILLFAKEILLIGVILSLGFVAYVLATVVPEKVTHHLSNKGVRTGGKLYPWGWIMQYWWEEKWKQKVLHMRLPGQFPGELILLLGEGDKEEIELVVAKYLVKQKPEATWFDRAAKWLQEKVPLESE